LGHCRYCRFSGKSLGPLDLAMFCSIGLIDGVSQFWVTQALHYAPAAAVSPFNYTRRRSRSRDGAAVSRSARLRR
jgi:hypothetical protein